MGHHNPIINLSRSLAGSFSNNRFIAFAMDHDLPFSFAQIAARFWVFHDQQAPLFKFMNRGVYVTRDIVA